MEFERGRYTEHRHRPPGPEFENSLLFSDVLKQIAQDKNRAVEPSIESIDLGQFQHLTEGLWFFAFKEGKQEQTEFASYFYLNNQGVRLLPTILRGDGGSVGVLFLEPFVEFEGADKVEKILGIFHTHPQIGYSFPSPLDLGHLLTPGEAQSRFGMIDPLLFIGTISKELKTVAFRGPNTPTLSLDQVESYLQTSNRLGKRKYFEFYRDPTESKNPVIIGLRTVDMPTLLFTRAAIDFDLQIFQGEINSPFLTRRNMRAVNYTQRPTT